MAFDAYGMALAYVWGRQDAGDSQRDTGLSSTFAALYRLAHEVTDGYAGPLQAAYHEWHDTGRIVRVMAGTGRIVAIAPREDGTAAEVRPIPWAGDRYSLPYWPGLTRTPAAA